MPDEPEHQDIAGQQQTEYCGTFGSPAGVKVLEDLKREFHFVEGTYVRGDPHETSFREGERNVILYILTKMLPPPDRQRIVKEIEDDGRSYAGI